MALQQIANLSNRILARPVRPAVLEDACQHDSVPPLPRPDCRPCTRL